MTSPPYWSSFPDFDGAPLVLTDGGLETAMIHEHGFDLPQFASFCLLDDPRGRAALRKYYEDYLGLARRHRLPILIDTPTWRASPRWAGLVGYDVERLASATERAVELVAEIRRSAPADQPPVGIGGCLGPRGDAYAATSDLSVEEAERYHATQIATMAGSEVDFVSALTLGSIEEAVGIARACRAVELPVVLSFTVETDGRLASGLSLAAAVEAVDRATGSYTAFYMVNCAHPMHFADTLRRGGDAIRRVEGVRVNASRKSHAELDGSDELDAGDPPSLGKGLGLLAREVPQLRVFGGCCGTSPRHVDEIARAVSR